MESKNLIKLAHVNFAKGFRGGERQTLLLIKELAHRGYIQKVITRKESDLAKKLEGTKNLEIIKISKPYILHLSQIADVSLIHAHETKGAQFSYFANLIFKRPYIITRRVDNPIKNNFFNKKIYQNSKYTIALSNAIKDETLKIDNDINIKIIPSAYSQLNTNAIKIKNIKNQFKDKFLIGHIGELDNTHKGQFYLIEAMKTIAEKYPEIHLILLGRGKDEQKYKNQANNLTNITFEGFVDNVGDYIQCFDMFVFPSLHEGLGSILFDVMQSNVPIIATNTGGIPDIIQNDKNGILVPIKNVEEIYKAIEKLYLDKILRDRLAHDSLKNIEQYSFTNMTDKYINLYTEILKK